MYDARTDITADETIGALAARAARYPVFLRSSQLRITRREFTCEDGVDPGIRWLLLNTRQINRCMMGTG